MLAICQTYAAPKPYYVATGPIAYSAYSPFASPYLIPSYVSPYAYDGFGKYL